MNFTDEEKISLFDKISSAYFERNFGSMSKADLETLLFSEYIEHCLNNKDDFDDYTLSKQLGITQQRVRSLKERKELKYPYRNFVWEDSFAESVKNAKFDKSDRYIKMIIEDVNVMNEIRHYIEKKGWYDECSLNKKMLRIPIECFWDICLKDTPDNMVLSDSAKQNIQKIKLDDDPLSALKEDFSKEGLMAVLRKSSKPAIVAVLNSLELDGMPGIVVNALSDIIEKS